MDSDQLAAYYYQDEEQVICGQVIPSITEDYKDTEFPSMVDRFFTRYYYLKKGADLAPYKVLFHSNRVCLICLANEHPAFTEGIASVNFDIGHSDRSKNAVKGKAKKGGMVLQADSTLALLTTKTSKVYKIPSCVRSKLIEVNVDLQTCCEKLQAPEGEGFIAIVLPKPEHCEEIKAGLMTQEQYDDYLRTIKEDKAE
ncbi:protein Abitram [Glossina fuscipes fuscipes]